MTHTVTQYSIGTVLSWVESGQIAIPEIQRPFVWPSTKVRDLVDSLYRGYPVGYLITWNTPHARLKDGRDALAKQILIDGQQRVTALTTAMVGLQITDRDYSRRRIQIAFDPIEERFETFTPVMRNNPRWVHDIAVALAPTAPLTLVKDYMSANPDADEAVVVERLARLLDIKNRQVGVITLASDLDIVTVSEIFVRINSSGSRLTPADFAMSRIASHGERGSDLRKQIDYFCHLSKHPAMYDTLAANDPEFTSSDYFQSIAWLRDDSSDLYDPDYQDVLRVAGMVGFGRGRMASVVSALSGIDPDTKRSDPELAERSFDRLESALNTIVRKHDFTHFRLVLSSAGYISAGMLTSDNAVNFAYALYLRMRASGVAFPTIQSVVRRWFVMSMLTGRAAGSFETAWDQDLKRVDEQGAEEVLDSIERAVLSDGFWLETLPQNLRTSSTRSPFFTAYLASQVSDSSPGFLSDSVTVAAMLGDTGQGDIHHVFPKEYLKKHGFNDRTSINQVANLVVAETPVNIRISQLAPAEYMTRVRDQIANDAVDLGGIRDASRLQVNLQLHAIPDAFEDCDASQYEGFLEDRRRLMAQRIRAYYEGLR